MKKLLIFLLAGIFMISSASAFLNIDSFSKNQTQSFGTIAIKTWWNLPLISGAVASYELRSVSDDIIEGRQHYHVIFGEKGTLFDDIFAYNSYGGKSDLLDKNILIKKTQQRTREVPIYNPLLCEDGSKVSPDKLCANKKIGSKNVTESIEVWDEYKGEVLDPGEYDATVVIHRNPNHPLDIVPSARGFELTKFAWFNTAWGNKIPIQINFSNGTTVANYTVSINVTYLTSMQTTGGSTTAFGDIRIINESETGQLGYWFYNNTVFNGTEVRVDFMLDVNVSPSRNYTAYLYYNNSAVNTTSNISGSGLFGDDFSNGSIDWTTKWQSNQQADYAIVGGSGTAARLLATGDATTTNNIQTQQVFENNYTIEMRGNTSLATTFWGLYPIVPNLGFSSTEENIKDAAAGMRLTMNGATTATGTWLTDVYYIHKATIASNTSNQSIGWENGTQVVSQQALASSAASRFGFLKYTNGFGSVDWVRVTRYYPYTVNWSFGTSASLAASITVALNSPANNSIIGSSTTFNSTYTPANANLTNATIYIWWDNNSTLLNTTTVLFNGTGNTNTSLITVTGLADAVYRWNVRGCANGTSSSICSFAATNNTLTVDTQNPQITYGAQTEMNGSLVARNFIIVNASVIEPNLNNTNISLFNSAGAYVRSNITAVNGSFFINFTSVADGVYFFNATAQDSSGNRNQTDTRTITVDVTPPTWTFGTGTETNATNLTRGFIVINVTGSDATAGLANITIYLVNSSTIINQTTTTISPNYVNISGLSDGIYFFNATVTDLGNLKNNTSTRTVTIDTTAPNVTIQAPTALLPYFVSGTNLSFNWTISDALLNLSTCFYDFNGINTTVTINLCRNASISVNMTTFFPRGFAVYANDTNQNQGRNSTTWEYGIFEVSQTQPTSQLEGTQVPFQINISYNNTMYPSIVANLVFNGTSSGGIQTGSSSNVLFMNTINLPVILSQQNISYYWYFSLSNATSTLQVNSSLQNQSVTLLNIGNCTQYSTIIINATQKDQDTESLLSNITYNTSVDVSVNLTTINTYTWIANFSGHYNSTNPVQVCLQTNLSNTSYRLDGTINYGASGYVNQFNNFQNYTINSNNTPINVSLASLLTTRSQQFVITAKDGNFNVVPNALIDIQRFYVPQSAYKSIETPIADNSGKALGHFVIADVIYTLVIKKNGQIISIFPQIRPVCNNQATGDCNLLLSAPSQTIQTVNFQTYRNFNVSLTENVSARTITANFMTLDGSIAPFEFNVTQLDNVGNISVCSNALTTSSGSFTCNVPASQGNVSLLLSLTSGGAYITQGIISLAPTANSTYGNTNIILIALLFMTLPMMGLVSGYAIILFAFVGLFLGIMMNFIDSPSILGAGATLLWWVAAAGIIWWKMSRRDY